MVNACLDWSFLGLGFVSDMLNTYDQAYHPQATNNPILTSTSQYFGHNDCESQ